MTKGKKIMFSLFSLMILVVSLYFLTTTKLQRVTKTTWKQARAIEVILAECNVVYEKIEWSDANYVMSNKGIYEYYDVFDGSENKYLLTLAVHNKHAYKQVYGLRNQTDDIVLYKNEDVASKPPPGFKL